MQFEAIRRLVDGIPYIRPEQGLVLYEHVRRYRPMQVLELGIGHGVSSCYLAAALQENGTGHLTCVDLVGASFSPSAEDLVRRAGLEQQVTIHREVSGYTWFLKKLIERRSPPGGVCEPLFDLCYIDGPKNWTIDSAAFFMVDKLLNEGAWLIFDDYDWTYDQSGSDSSDGIALAGLAEDERSSPHIEAIFRLLVMQHPVYGEFRIDGNTWAWARKVRGGDRLVRLTYTPDLRYSMYTRLRGLYRLLRRRAGI